MLSEPKSNNYVFVNCPFDTEYAPMLNAIVYTIYRCGFSVQTALNEDDATENRLDKIIRCIGDCRYGIHDISRTELNKAGLPRFNMPFELGIFFGAKKLGTHKQRNKSGMVFEREKYSYQQFISDLNGIDTKAHSNKPTKAIEQSRNWLRIVSKRTTIPGAEQVKTDYTNFKKKLPGIAVRLGFDPANILFNDYCLIVEEHIKKRIGNK